MGKQHTMVGKLLAIGLAIGLPAIVLCQSPIVAAVLDKSKLLIGEQATLKVAVSFPENGYAVTWFAQPDSLPHFELVSVGPIDTVRNNGTMELHQALVFTSFDSGQWKTPPLQIQLLQQGMAKPRILTAAPITYDVTFMADSSADIKDIKPIIDADAEKSGWPWRLFLAIGLGALAILGVLGWLLYRWIRSGAGKMVALGSQSAYQQAMQQLAALQQLNLAKPDECRRYHTRLSQLFKEYMGYKLGLALTNKTTGDTLLTFKEKGLSASVLSGASAALRGCDAVKFAKFMPDAGQSAIWYNELKNIMEQIEKQPPAQA